MAAAKKNWSLLWAARFIAKWEGFSADAYWDTLGQVWTIGYGHTGNVHAGDHWSHAHALRVLVKDCRTVRQRIALISFVFNLGAGILPGSDLLKALNTGHIHQAATLMLEYDHAGGEVVNGLRNRRKAERWLMLHSQR
jgi:lysozyme